MALLIRAPGGLPPLSNALLSAQYAPVRLPARAADGYLFPLAVASSFDSAPRPGLPGSSADLSLRAVPSHPGKSGDCIYPLLLHRCQASSQSGGLATSIRNEAETGSLALRLTVSPFEASSNGLLRSTLDWLHGEWAIHMVSSFHLTRSARLGLAHPMNGINADDQI